MESRTKRRRTLPSQPLLSTSPVELFLLAGLPNPQHTRAEVFLKQIAGPYSKVIAVASGSHDWHLFRQGTVDTLVRGAAQFAIRRFKNRSDDQVARPRRIVLFYVPADDDQQLLAAFDFFVFPVPLRDLATFDESGSQMRHQLPACKRAIEEAFDVYSRDLVGAVQRRIESRKSSEPLLLPPLNFHLPGRPLQHSFWELTRGTRTWENALPENVVAEVFDRQRLPDFLGYQERQVMYRDARDVVFPCARPSELHGQQLPETKTGDPVSVLQDFLRSAYRFGTPLPDGFHHDAQLEHGRHFDNMKFQCSRNGPILVSGSHANIYPNDYVRPGP
jgi:hypothetical protein